MLSTADERAQVFARAESVVSVPTQTNNKFLGLYNMWMGRVITEMHRKQKVSFIF